ncbi:MAG: hypothetical protein K0S25_59 [Bacillus sp. (in: firmicutes)]|jgi:hypothetical protein|nr:hypothetical protein [Bacillus sp. (in: firmicutes)]
MQSYIVDSKGRGFDTKNPLQVQSNATQAVAVVPNDATILTATKGLYIGISGDVVVTMANGQDATFKSLAVGMIHPISVTKVKATGTTATNILAVY